jgi:hypothetical protein
MIPKADMDVEYQRILVVGQRNNLAAIFCLFWWSKGGILLQDVLFSNSCYPLYIVPFEVSKDN